MQHSRFCLVISIIFLILQEQFGIASAQTLEDYAPPKELVNSVVLLSSENGRCGTGFISNENQIYTNAHVINSICPARDCKKIKLHRANAVGQPANEEIKHGSLKVLKISAVLDMAVIVADIDSQNEFKGSLMLSSDAPIANENVYSLGFPGCKNLTLSSGVIKSSQALRVFTTTSGSHGISGSPLINRDGKVKAIVNQAASISGGLKSLLAGSNFENRAVPINTVTEVFNDYSNSLVIEARLINQFYRENVRPLEGSMRIRESLEFSQRLRGLLDDAVNFPELLQNVAPLLALDKDLLFLAGLPYKENVLTNEIEKIAFANALEVRGLSDQRLVPIDRASIHNALKNSARPDPQITALMDLVDTARNQKFSGLYVYAAGYLLPLFCILILLFFIYTFSLGYVFARSHGGLLKRIGKTLLIAIAFWPISLIVFVFYNKKNNRN